MAFYNRDILSRYLVRLALLARLPRKAIKHSHGCPLISVSARPLSKEVLEQTKGCRDKFMIQTMTVTVDQLIDEGVIDVKKAELSQIRKGRSCTLDLAHILPENVSTPCV